MELVERLGAAQDTVLQNASETLGRTHLPHYRASGPTETHRRLEDLFVLVIQCLAERTLVPMSRYAEAVAEERFDAGFDIAEVQTAFNVLEEAIWRSVMADLPPEDLVAAAGLIGTVLGAGKDELARKWVSLATCQHVATLDLSALFQGAAG